MKANTQRYTARCHANRGKGRIAHSLACLFACCLAVLPGGCERYVYFWEDRTFDRRSDSLVVAKGDTLYALARRHGLVLRDLIEVNHLRPPYLLKPGQRLKKPRPRVHIVARGDTAYSVARRYGVDVYSLIRLNRLDNRALIQPGQTLVLPPPLDVSVSSSSEITHTAPRGQKETTRDRASRSGESGSRKSARVPPAAVGKKTPSTQFAWPLRGQVVLPYGPQAQGRFNDGINIKAQAGAAIRAVQSGVVVYVGNELPGFGNLLIIKHANGWTSAYAQCESILVTRGQRIKKGQIVAKVGSTGNVSQPQLHFELRHRTRPVDPRAHLA